MPYQWISRRNLGRPCYPQQPWCYPVLRRDVTSALPASPHARCSRRCSRGAAASRAALARRPPDPHGEAAAAESHSQDPPWPERRYERTPWPLQPLRRGSGCPASGKQGAEAPGSAPARPAFAEPSRRDTESFGAVQLVEDEEQEVPRKKQKSAEVTSDDAGEVSVARKRLLKAKEKPQGSAARGPAAEALEAAARAALGPGDPREVLSSAFKLRVTREAMGTLREGQWLNDEVINFYLQLVAERSRKAGYPSVHAFSTFFYPKLVSGGYEGVRRWTRGLDIFQKDIILVPIHLGIHWALVVIDVRRKTISYYDSLGQRGMKICQALLQYLQEESRSRRGLELASAEWALHSMGAQEIPQQRNQSDCGVFLCKYAESICRDRAITFSQRHMPSFRKKMVWEILHQQLL
ncbi:sentrin-specific protease 2-like [Melanerpes formicivorus]|uniref:sentrin-specific protease 2-like n=1 Tax=Melanerpes formicivorus TaxID=211600 RepID=UPI00358FE8DB